MNGLWQDWRFGLRMLAKSPGFTAVAVLSLGLGIGGSTTIFSVISTFRYRPLPFRDPERLMVIREANPEKGISTRNPTFATVKAIREQARSFEQVGLFSGPRPVTLSGEGRAADRVLSRSVGGELFSVLGVKPLLGRTLTPTDAVWGQPSGILLSYGTWQTRYGGDTDIVGKMLRVDGRNRRVIGVMPQGFWVSPWAGKVSYWECNELDPIPETRWMVKVARLKPGVQQERAAAETTPLIQRTEESFGNDPAGLLRRS